MKFHTGKNIAKAFFPFFMAILLWLSPAMATEEPVLRENIIVYDDIVKLGDLFENSGVLKAVAVFRSPDYGADGIISALRVQDAARKHGLDWKNHGGVDKVLVRRPSRVITLNEIRDLLKNSLLDKSGVRDPDDLSITFATGSNDIHIDSRNKSPLVVINLWYNRQGKSFQAIIGTEESTGNIPRATMNGRADHTNLVVVPSVALEPGKEITEQELKMVRFPVDRLRTGAIRDIGKVVGKAAKYRLSPNQFLREQDLEIPKIIKTNELVSIRYSVPGIFLKAEGRALGAGTKGDVIPVLNTQSKLKIQAVILGPGSVEPAKKPVRILEQPSKASWLKRRQADREKAKK